MLLLTAIFLHFCAKSTRYTYLSRFFEGSRLVPISAKHFGRVCDLAKTSFSLLILLKLNDVLQSPGSGV
jgi:hypothetical protein